MQRSSRSLLITGTGVILYLLVLVQLLFFSKTNNRTIFLYITISSVLLLFASWRQTSLQLRKQKRDIQTAEGSLQAALTHERAILLEQRLFLSMVSHEFRTPLAVLDSAATNLMAVPPADRDDLEQRATQMKRATRSLSHLVDNCLVSERIELGGFHPIYKEVRVLSVLSAAASLVNWSPRHTCKIVCDELELRWQLDPTLIRIALSNLIDNAVKYSENGLVTISAERKESELYITIGDEGRGIATDKAEQLFQKYARGDCAQQGRKVRGSGLGLYTCRLIVQSHGGHVSLRSGLPGATVFEISLPRRQEIIE